MRWPCRWRRASDHEGDGPALCEGHEEAAGTDAGRALRTHRLQPQLCGAPCAGASAGAGAAEGGRERPRTYTAELLPALRKVWATLDRCCGKRLAAVMEATIAALERHHEISLTPEHRELLYSASPAPSTACSPPSAAACASKAAP